MGTGRENVKQMKRRRKTDKRPVVDVLGERGSWSLEGITRTGRYRELEKGKRHRKRKMAEKIEHNILCPAQPVRPSVPMSPCNADSMDGWMSHIVCHVSCNKDEEKENVMIGRGIIQASNSRGNKIPMSRKQIELE
jgi:hypothetical protein